MGTPYTIQITQPVDPNTNGIKQKTKKSDDNDNDNDSPYNDLKYETPTNQILSEDSPTSMYVESGIQDDVDPTNPIHQHIKKTLGDTRSSF